MIYIYIYIYIYDNYVSFCMSILKIENSILSKRMEVKKYLKIWKSFTLTSQLLML